MSCTNCKSRDVDFVRLNMSHSNIEDLKYSISNKQKVENPFIIDIEGAQIRSDPIKNRGIKLEENDEIEVE